MSEVLVIPKQREEAQGDTAEQEPTVLAPPLAQAVELLFV
jgi:hypothetical protein